MSWVRLSAGSVMGLLNQKNMFREASKESQVSCGLLSCSLSLSVSRLTAGLATAILLAGCSSDVSRLADGPFGAVDHTPTASIGSQQALLPPESVNNGGYSNSSSGRSSGAAPSSPVRSAPLAPLSSVQSAPLAPPQASYQSPAIAPAPALPARPTFTTPAAKSIAPKASAGAAPAVANVGPWSAAGGSAVTVGAGESLAALSSRYGVPQDTLLKVNGLSSASQVVPGSRLTIPVYNATGAALAPAVAPAAAAAKVDASRAAATKAAADKLSAAKEPVAKAPAAIDPKVALKEKAAAEKAALAAGKAEAAKAAKTRVAEEAPVVDKRAKVAAAEAPETTGSTPADSKPEFRWPARGRIIQGFRSGANEGINIALPEGTSVKAAESGVVAYAGSELKGYGNLVLIRHPNGYVSAYAHNGEVAVKRGETVKRGQTIAKSGQSGNVASPQLHFELRKGSTPVDPTGYLAGL